MKNFAQALITVLEARNETAPSNDLKTSINNARSHARALDQLFSQKSFAPIAKRLLDSISIVSPKDNREDFVAVKVVVKIINTANGIAKAEKSLVDPYSKTIIENLVSLQGLSNKSALVSLSNSIHYTEDDQKQKLTSKYGCSAGTAGTQASSTRMMLRSLDICEVLKSKRGDTLSLKENDRAAMLVGLFTGKPVAMTEEKAEPVKRATAAKKPAAPKAEPVKPAPKATAAKKPTAAKALPKKTADAKPVTGKAVKVAGGKVKK